MYEAISLDDLRKAEMRTEGFHHEESDEKILHPEQTVYQWYAEVVNAKCKPVSTSHLGAPRITEGKYEASDGTPVDLSLDLCGERRDEESVIPGAIAKLCAGVNRMTVWRGNR